MDEKTLVDQLRRNDPGAQSRVYRDWYSKLYKTCAHVLGYRDPEIEDVLQETFLAAFGRIGSFQYRGEGSLFAWVKQICVNRCYSRWREKDRLLLAQEKEMEGLTRTLEKRQEDDRRAHEEKEARILLIAGMKNKLDPPCRDLIELRDVRGESYAAIGRFLRMPMGTVMSRLSRCREFLKRLVMSALGRET